MLTHTHTHTELTGYTCMDTYGGTLCIQEQKYRQGAAKLERGKIVLLLPRSEKDVKTGKDTLSN